MKDVGTLLRVTVHSYLVPAEFILVNQAMIRLAECENIEEFKEWTKNSFKEFVHPDDICDTENSIKEQIESDPYGNDYVEYRIHCKDGSVYEMNDPMFFGVTDRIAKITLRDFTNVLIIRMRGVPAIDISAMLCFEDLYKECKKHHVNLMFAHVNEQPMTEFEHAGFVERLGRQNFLPHIDDALARADMLLGIEEKSL